MRLVLRGNFGMALEWQRPVSEVIGDRLWLTMVVSVAAIILTWLLALPIGVYSAVRQYSVGDYVATFIGFIGLAVPSFLLALVLMYLGFRYFNASIGGLFSDEFSRGAVEPGQGVGHGQTPAPSRAHPGAGGDRAAHPNHAGEPARRAPETVRDDGASTGRARASGDPQVPRAGRPQPLREHDRLPLPVRRLRKHHRFPRPQPADRGAAPPDGRSSPRTCSWPARSCSCSES